MHDWGTAQSWQMIADENRAAATAAATSASASDAQHEGAVAVEQIAGLVDRECSVCKLNALDVADAIRAVDAEESTAATATTTSTATPATRRIGV